MTDDQHPAPLEPVPEDWERGLAIIAHPDDIEYVAAAVARWTDAGKQIAYCLLTSGEAGIDSLDPAESGPLREQEQRDAAAVVGVTDVEFLGYPDGILEYGIGLRRDITRVVRRYRPQMLFTNNFRETWDGTALNQPDHMVAGRAVLDAARDAGNRWVFRDSGRRGTRALAGRPRRLGGLVTAVQPRGRRHRHLRAWPGVLPRAQDLSRCSRTGGTRPAGVHGGTVTHGGHPARHPFRGGVRGPAAAAVVMLHNRRRRSPMRRCQTKRPHDDR